MLSGWVWVWVGLGLVGLVLVGLDLGLVGLGLVVNLNTQEDPTQIHGIISTWKYRSHFGSRYKLGCRGDAQAFFPFTALTFAVSSAI